MTTAPPETGDAATQLETNTLVRNDDIFGRLILAAEASAESGRYRSASEWAWIAARFATTNPTLRLRSARLEQVFDRIAAGALMPSPAATVRPDGRLRVLHVLSEAYSIGGLNRLVERWIHRDAAHQSSVVITRQDELVPALAEAANASGGHGYALGEETDPISRAGTLRQLAEDADYVFCHLNPEDHVAAMAFGEGYSGAPVAIFNHSDHMFLLAPTQASLIIDFREVGSVLTQVARGYAAESRYRLPLIVPESQRTTVDRDQTRLALGISADQVVALTLARAVKFQDTPFRPRFSDLVDRALSENPDLVMCAVGATPADEPWGRLAARFPGRVHAVGPTPDPQPYLAAADLYLDTFPFSSLTSLLEASACARPVLTYDGHKGLRRALGIADFTATETDRPGDLESYFARISELANNSDVRRERGVHAQELFRSLGSETQWLERLQGLYRALDHAAEGPRLGASPAPPTNAAITDHNRAILAMESQHLLLLYLTGGLPRFDAPDRLRLRWRILAVRAVRKLATSLGRSHRTFEKLLIPTVRRSGPR